MKDKIFKIEKMDYYGNGIIHSDNKVIFVQNAVELDEVTLNVIKNSKKYVLSEVKEYIVKSPYRRNMKCKYQNLCGGCNIIDLEYERQLKLKEDKVKDHFRMHLNFNEVDNIVANDEEFNYRNKITLHVDKELGLYQKSSKKIVAISECKLVNAKINEVINKISAINYSKIKEIMIKTNGNDVLVAILGNVNSEDLVKLDFNSIILNDKIIKGNGYIIQELLDLKFKVSNKSFFQVNKDVTEKLYSHVLKMIPDGINKALDLYCGTGTIGLIIARKIKNVVGIEIVKEAIIDANYNKELNKIDNIKFICGKVEDYIDSYKDVNLIVVDPPRAGLDKYTVKNIIEIKPDEVIYISCNIETLIRDLKELSNYYDISQVTPFDMFPNTYHVETVCLLSKLRTNHHIEVNLNMDELDVTSAESKATYDRIKEYILENNGLKVSSLYIAQVKEKIGIKERENYNHPKKEDAKVPRCPANKERIIVAALKHFNMID